MNSNAIINDNMTLEEKLQAISDAMEQAQQAAKNGQVAAPIDPATFTICDGCE